MNTCNGWTRRIGVHTNEYGYATDDEANSKRRYFIDAGRSVSLIAYDVERNLYVFDVTV
jgi:hypothetical protein